MLSLLAAFLLTSAPARAAAKTDPVQDLKRPRNLARLDLGMEARLKRIQRKLLVLRKARRDRLWRSRLKKLDKRLLARIQVARQLQRRERSHDRQVAREYKDRVKRIAAVYSKRRQAHSAKQRVYARLARQAQKLSHAYTAPALQERLLLVKKLLRMNVARRKGRAGEIMRNRSLSRARDRQFSAEKRQLRGMKRDERSDIRWFKRVSGNVVFARNMKTDKERWRALRHLKNRLRKAASAECKEQQREVEYARAEAAFSGSPDDRKDLDREQREERKACALERRVDKELSSLPKASKPALQALVRIAKPLLKFNEKESRRNDLEWLEDLRHNRIPKL